MHLNTRVIFTLYTIYGTLFKGECRVRLGGSVKKWQGRAVTTRVPAG